LQCRALKALFAAPRPTCAARRCETMDMDNAFEGIPLPRRTWSILTIALGLTLAVMDSAIANVALPTIARDLNTNAAYSIWVVNGYQLAITVSLLPLASLGDILGYRRVYLAGVVVFTLASLACAFSHTLVALALARVVQGFGAAGIMSVNAALVRFTWPQRLLGRGIGINAVVISIAAAVGPTVASGILSVAHWKWLFAVNVPIGIAVLLIGPYALPRTPRAKHEFDIAGAMLSAAAFGFLIMAIDAGGHGESGWLCVASAAIALAAGYFLVGRERHYKTPMLPVDLLRIPVFSLSVATSVCSFMAQMLALVVLPFLLQDRGYTAVQTGLLMTPWPLAVGVAAPLAGYLADKYPAGLLGGGGLLTLSLGLLLLGLMPAEPSQFDVCWRMAICGIGFGFFQSPNNRAMLTAAPRERSGAAGGALGTARLLGQTIGAALVALFFGRIAEHATTVSLLVAAAIALVAAGVSSLRLMNIAPPEHGRAPAE